MRHYLRAEYPPKAPILKSWIFEISRTDKASRPAGEVSQEGEQLKSSYDVRPIPIISVPVCEDSSDEDEPLTVPVATSDVSVRTRMRLQTF